MAFTSKNKFNAYTMDEFKSEYARQSKIWEESKTRQFLVEQLERFTPGQIAGVKKIFGFALGDVSMLKASYEGDVQRPFAQHATLKTIAKFLEEHNGGREVPCYSQDPALTDGYGAEFIKSIGITPLDDPNGFLEVDESTFVVSIAPNIPVRQVIADITKPRAMLWDSVGEINGNEWTWSENEDGRIKWECPYTTDSTSPRVAALVEDYDHLDFVDHDKWFCATALYARKN
ncbi:hypothetical protein LTS12_029813 [Elasticomyces elasticus]|nr:hypothetical protein LTS12_029813 [Elasticomyces elasticus]